MIRRWIALWDGTEPPLVLALVRLAVGSLVAADLLEVRHLGLVPVFWAPSSVGGLRELSAHVPEVFQIFGPTTTAAWVLWTTATAAAVLFALGFMTRTSAVVLLLAYGQMALVLPNGDRGIDTILRNVIAILLFSRCGATLSVDCLYSTGRLSSADPVPRWPRRLLILQVAAIYFLSAAQKIGFVWTPLGGFSALWYVLHDTQITRFDAPETLAFYRVTQLGTAGTLLFEATFPFLLALHRRWGSGHFDPRRLWLSVGIFFHLGLAATVKLGIFPWAMMTLYLVFFTPAEVEAALVRRFGGPRG